MYKQPSTIEEISVKMDEISKSILKILENLKQSKIHSIMVSCVEMARIP